MCWGGVNGLQHSSPSMPGCPSRALEQRLQLSRRHVQQRGPRRAAARGRRRARAGGRGRRRVRVGLHARQPPQVGVLHAVPRARRRRDTPRRRAAGAGAVVGCARGAAHSLDDITASLRKAVLVL